VYIVRPVAVTWKTDKWTVGIAFAAFLVSLLSLAEVHEQVNLARGQIRSYVQVVDLKLVQPIPESSFIQLQARVKNFGQTAAVNVYGEMDYDVGIPGANGDGNDATRREVGSMGPGMERTVIRTSNRMNHGNWPTPVQRGFQTIYFFGSFWFTDDTTHEERAEDWCYELPLKTEGDFKTTELQPCDNLTYTSKGNRKTLR
jgi:hypothetical protein